MNLHKFLGHINGIIRPVTITIVLLTLQKLGLLDLFLEQNPKLRVDSLAKIFTALLLIVTGYWAVDTSVSHIWNRLTPVQNKATYIEDELCYSLAVSLGTAVFCMIWLIQPLSVATKIFGLVSLASWPGILIGWLIQRWREKLSPHINNVKPEDIPSLQEEHFWKRRFAYIIAAIVFNIASILSIQAILLFRSGQFGDWWSIISSCSSITFITLVLFGKFIVELGHKVLRLLSFKIGNERRRHSLAYASGYMTFLAVIVGITLTAMYFGNQAESMLSWWAYALSFIIISGCALLAGVSFGYLYTPPRQAL